MAEARKWDQWGTEQGDGGKGETVRMRGAEGGANVVLYHSGVWVSAVQDVTHGKG